MATYIGKVKALGKDRLLVFYNISNMKDLSLEVVMCGYNPYDVCFAQIDDMVSSIEFTITEFKDGNDYIPFLKFADQGDISVKFNLLEILHNLNTKWFYLSEDFEEYLTKVKA